MNIDITYEDLRCLMEVGIVLGVSPTINEKTMKLKRFSAYPVTGRIDNEVIIHINDKTIVAPVTLTDARKFGLKGICAEYGFIFILEDR